MIPFIKRVAASSGNIILSHYSTSTSTASASASIAPKLFSAATTAASEFRKLLFHLPQLDTSSTQQSPPLAFLLSPEDLKSSLEPINETIDTSEFIEPTLKHLLSLPLQSKAQVNKFNLQSARSFFSRSPNDTGSVEVQCGQLTARMIYLGEHCAKHKHDYKSQRKIVELVAIRRKFLKYLRKVSLERYYRLIDQLSLPPNYLEAFETNCSYKNLKK
jgi:small subunit ribosomal protein S15